MNILYITDNGLCGYHTFFAHWISALKEQVDLELVHLDCDSKEFEMQLHNSISDSDADVVIFNLKLRKFSQKRINLPNNKIKVLLEPDAFLNFTDTNVSGLVTRQSVERVFDKGNFDLLVVRDSYSYNSFKSLSFPVFWNPHAADANVFRDRKSMRTNSIGFVGSTYENMYSERARLVKYIRDNFSDGIVRDQNLRVFGDEYIDVLNSCKFFVSTPISPAPYIQATELKVYEALACGAVLVRKNTAEMKQLGFCAFEHFIPLEEIEELGSLIASSMNDYQLYKRVQKSGSELVRNQHNWNKRATELLKYLSEKFYSIRAS